MGGTRGGTRVRRRRVWSETLSHEEIGRPRVMGLLRRYELELFFAVRPGESRSAAKLLGIAEDAGVWAGVWPMVEDREGRWASCRNGERFAAFARGLIEDLAARGALPRALAVDLEPPMAAMKAAAAVAGADTDTGTDTGTDAGTGTDTDTDTRTDTGTDTGTDTDAGTRTRTASGAAAGARALDDLVKATLARGIEVSAAVMPFVLFDPPRGRPGLWQAILGTPVDGVPYSTVSAMLYTSMIEGWSRGLVDRRDARALLAAFCDLARARWGDRASVSLGAVGTGALENEPVYRGPHELAEDAAIAASRGISDFTLFDLGGVVRRAPAEAWLEALVAPPPSAEERAEGGENTKEPPPRPSRKIRAAIAAAVAAGEIARIVGLPLRFASVPHR
jgi:hypothetical protein